MALQKQPLERSINTRKKPLQTTPTSSTDEYKARTKVLAFLFPDGRQKLAFERQDGNKKVRPEGAWLCILRMTLRESSDRRELTPATGDELRGTGYEFFGTPESLTVVRQAYFQRSAGKQKSKTRRGLALYSQNDVHRRTER
ncbi:hypothetical protein D3A96_15060 [Robertkochia marina]|nr:hypothetical protein D3A96_15060 [Robertkochia marina]